MAFCPNCGYELGEDMAFCPRCGTNVRAYLGETDALVSVPNTAVTAYTAPDTNSTDSGYTTTNTYTNTYSDSTARSDFRVILVSRGSCSKSTCSELLRDILGYTRTEVNKILRNLPAEVACNMTVDQACTLAQALTEYGLQVSITNDSGYVDLSQFATHSVYNTDGSLMSDALRILTSLSIANRVSRFGVWNYHRPSLLRSIFMPRYRWEPPPHRWRMRPEPPRRPAPAPRPAAPRRDPSPGFGFGFGFGNTRPSSPRPSSSRPSGGSRPSSPRPGSGGSRPSFGGSRPSSGGSRPSFGSSRPSMGGKAGSVKVGGSRPSMGGKAGSPKMGGGGRGKR